MLNKAPIRSYQSYVHILITLATGTRGLRISSSLTSPAALEEPAKPLFITKEETSMPEALAREYSFSKGKVKERKKKTRSIKELGIENELVLSVHQTARVLHTSEARVRDLIRSGMLDGKEAEEAGDYIVNEGKRLENLSMKLLNMLMIKKEPLEFLLCSPAVLIRRLEENTAPIYKKRGIALETRVQPGECLIEPDLVYCLLKNLVENAANAMPDSGGKIIITQKMIKNGCRIFVKDNGCGIPENSMKHLTDPFYRVDRSRSRQAGGTGLGLSLCREIADIHGGYIRFRSMAEKGTVVMVALKGVRNEEPS